MHELQSKILELAEKNQLDGMNLRDIGDAIGENHLQKVKHHLNQLLAKNFIGIDSNGNYKVIKGGENHLRDSGLVSIPIYGSANCGLAEIFAEDNLEGYLEVSEKFIKFKPSLIALRAVGDSMNRASIVGQMVNPGDYLIIDTDERSPKDGDYVLSIFNNMANIKRFFFDKSRRTVTLISESNRSIPPIVADPDDSYMVAGKVLRVVKAHA